MLDLPFVMTGSAEKHLIRHGPHVEAARLIRPEVDHAGPGIALGRFEGEEDATVARPGLERGTLDGRLAHTARKTDPDETEPPLE